MGVDLFMSFINKIMGSKKSGKKEADIENKVIRRLGEDPDFIVQKVFQQIDLNEFIKDEKKINNERQRFLAFKTSDNIYIIDSDANIYNKKDINENKIIPSAKLEFNHKKIIKEYGVKNSDLLPSSSYLAVNKIFYIPQNSTITKLIKEIIMFEVSKKLEKEEIFKRILKYF